MITLTDRDAMRRAIRDPTLTPALRAVLKLRAGQFGARFHVIQPGDTVADAAATVGWPLVDDGIPQWEWSRFHAGGVTELTFVLSDDGPAEVLLVPSLPDVDAELRRLCRQVA